VRPFALHRQQPENDKRNVDFAPSGKNSSDAHGNVFYCLCILVLKRRNSLCVVEYCLSGKVTCVSIVDLT